MAELEVKDALIRDVRTLSWKPYPDGKTHLTTTFTVVLSDGHFYANYRYVEGKDNANLKVLRNFTGALSNQDLEGKTIRVAFSKPDEGKWPIHAFGHKSEDKFIPYLESYGVAKVYTLEELKNYLKTQFSNV